MSFLDEIKEMQKDRNNKENIVINEILQYFREKLDRDKFKEVIKDSYIHNAINGGKNSCILKVEFWEHHSGCSATYIYVGGCGKFELEGQESRYKGVRLQDIHKRICSKLSDMLEDKIKELGLKVISSRRLDDEYRFGYYKEHIEISWE